MDKIRLGRTGLMVSRSGFGAIPIQRISYDDAKNLLRKAYDNGINFFDTARGYTDSEEKIGYALADVRDKIIIATKSHANDRNTLLKDLETSLKNLRTDYLDILQLHNPKTIPSYDESPDFYEALVKLREEGRIRFIGITNHSADRALQAAASELYDTIQFPINYLSAAKELEIINACRERDIGLIAMKGLSGGLITNAATAFAFLRQYDTVVPIWGMQRISELDEFLALEQAPPALDGATWERIRKDRAELAGEFCRACGYCLPCPAGIEIPTAARISLLMRRMPLSNFLNDNFRKKMDLIDQCQNCGHCKKNCPYELDTPNLLKKELLKFQNFPGAN